MGQDTYHGVGRAHGLSFSVPPHMPLPRSWKNMFSELKQRPRDCSDRRRDAFPLGRSERSSVAECDADGAKKKSPVPTTVRDGSASADAVIQALVEREDPVVFVLWGKAAQEKVAHILENKKTPHALLIATHPSPYSAYSSFGGCKHFSKINQLLTSWGEGPHRLGVVLTMQLPEHLRAHIDLCSAQGVSLKQIAEENVAPLFPLPSRWSWEEDRADLPLRKSKRLAYLLTRFPATNAALADVLRRLPEKE